MDAADLCSIGEETIPYGADRNGGVGGTITVEGGEAAATVPTVEFFEHDAFNIVGESHLTQTSRDASNFWGECTRIYVVDAQRVELNKNFE